MKKVFLLLGVSLLSFSSCKKNNSDKGGVITVNTTKLSKATAIFIKNNAVEVSRGNPSKAEDNYKFELADYNNDGVVDLYAIKKYNTETNATEIHILSGASNYKSSLLKTQTDLYADSFKYKFELGDYNNDGKVDLYAINNNDESNYAEVHVLSGSSNYKSSLLKTRTALNKVDANYEFELGDYNKDGKVDLYAITNNKESHFAEIHVLNGASNYTSSLLKTQTALNEDGVGYEFNLGDYDHDGKVDLYTLMTHKEQPNFAEISVLSGASNYRSSILKTRAVLNKVDTNYEFQFEDNYVPHKKQNRGTRLTAI